jgi:hypothetical protein
MHLPIDVQRAPGTRPAKLRWHRPRRGTSRAASPHHCAGGRGAFARSTCTCRSTFTSARHSPGKITMASSQEGHVTRSLPPSVRSAASSQQGHVTRSLPPRATLVRRDEQAVLISRALLVKIKRDIENQIRGLLKNLGLVIGRAKMNVFAMRAAELAQARPELGAAAEPLLKAREAVGQQIADLDRKVLRLARNNAQVRRFMTAPGVGPITALFFLATIDEPTRFKRSRSVGAYAGLTTRR